MHRLFHAIVIIMLLATGQVALAQENEHTVPEELLRTYERMHERTRSDSTFAERIVAAGRERAIFCNTCHGPDGNSIRPNYPSLAGQNPLYLLDQIEQFAVGSREKQVMNVLAETFNAEEKITLSLYYAQIELEGAQADAELAARGQPIYQARCASCHGENGLGEEGYARIAGQQPVYIGNVLREYRSGNSPRRFSAMYGIAGGLRNEDIDAVAHYVASLR